MNSSGRGLIISEPLYQRISLLTRPSQRSVRSNMDSTVSIWNFGKSSISKRPAILPSFSLLFRFCPCRDHCQARGFCVPSSEGVLTLHLLQTNQELQIRWSRGWFGPLNHHTDLQVPFVQGVGVDTMGKL